MRTRSRALLLSPLLLPLALAGCPEATPPVDGPPQPTVTPTASPTAIPTAAPTAQPNAKPAFENPGGMWMPEQMPAHAETLKKLGLAIDPAQLAKLDGAPMGAILSLGGCTASFVSPDGLAVTNHHCVTRWLGFASTPEKDYAGNGVNPKSRADEVWAGPSARVYVLQGMKDVTADMRAGLDKIKDEAARTKAVAKRRADLIAGCEKDRPGIRCSVSSFFGGGDFRLVEQLELKDVRLSYVPPESIGDYGGEVDNWRWPRHGGDFAFFRVYAGKDNQPADRAESNVPYKPKAHLSFASSPLTAGDLVFVAGYPAQTSRLKVTAEVEETALGVYPRRIEGNSAFIPLLEGFAAKSKELAQKTAPQMQGLSNGLIKMRGIVEALEKGGRVADKKKAEADLLAFIAADPERKAKWGGVIEAMNARVATMKEKREHDVRLNEILGTPRLFATAMLIVRLAEERAKPNADRHPDYQERNYKRFVDETVSMQRSYDREVEKALMKLALERAQRVNATDWPKFPSGKLLGKVTDQERTDRVAALYDKTKLEDVELRKKLMTTAKIADLKKLKDPLLDLALAARPEQREMQDRDEAMTGAFLLLAPKYVEAARAFAKSQGKPDIAPDANGTVRLTYGTVRGYKPKPDAPVYTPFTTLAELVAKHTGKTPFDAPKAELDAAKEGKKGPYLLADVGDVPVDFLTDVDITGGNSGSPTLNAKGEIVGLAFDGTYEGVASDWLFLPETTRTIHVDARYMLWVIDAVSGNAEILKELRVTPAFAK